MERLPIELWQTILEATDDQRSFNALARTCKLMASLASNGVVKRRAQFRLAQPILMCDRNFLLHCTSVLANGQCRGTYLIFCSNPETGREVQLGLSAYIDICGIEGEECLYGCRDNYLYPLLPEESSYKYGYWDKLLGTADARAILAAHKKGKYDRVFAARFCLKPLLRTTNFRGGKKEGIAITYDEGDVKMKCSYEHGLLDGQNERFYPDGQLHTLTHWKQGKPCGEWLSYYRHGVPRIRCTFQNVDLVMPVECFNEEGKMICRFGLMRPYSPSNEPCPRFLLEGAYEEWYGDGQLSVSKHYQKGQPIGEAREWDKDGSLLRKYHFEDGLLEGPFETYRGGELYTRHQFSAGIMLKSSALHYDAVAGEVMNWISDPIEDDYVIPSQ